MTPREFRQEKKLEFDHFQELTSTGIKPNYVNIELFAHEYLQAELRAFYNWHVENKGMSSILPNEIEEYLNSL